MSNGSGNGQFKDLMGIANNSKSEMFFTNMDDNRIEKFNVNMQFSKALGSRRNENSQLIYPRGNIIRKLTF